MEIGNGLGIVPPVFYFLFTYCFLALHSCILSYIFYVESLLAQKAVDQDQSRASKQKESKKKNPTSFHGESRRETEKMQINCQLIYTINFQIYFTTLLCGLLEVDGVVRCWA